MSFIGNVPAEAYSPVAKDTFSGDGSTTDFTPLSIPATTNSVEVFVENVQQEPTTAYTISGTTLSFTAAPVTGTNNIYVVHRGPAVQQIVPPAGVALNPSTVDATGDISTEGDLKVEVTSGGIYTITGTDTATNRTLTLPDEAGTVLTSGTPLSSFPSGFANGITRFETWHLTSNITTNTDPVTNLAIFTDGVNASYNAGMTQSSGIFTFPETGYWLILCSIMGNRSALDNIYFRVEYSSNAGSTWSNLAYVASSADSDTSASNFGVVDITDTAQRKVKFTVTSLTSGNIYGAANVSNSTILFMRLGDT